MPYRSLPVVLILMLYAAPGLAQTLSLADAIDEALAHNPGLRAARAGAGEAAARLSQARAGYLPRVDLVEAWQRGNQPVFVFGSLLAQRRFTAADFALDALNHPGALDNHRAAVSLEQTVFDGARTRASVRMAALGQQIAETGTAEARDELRLAVTRAFGQVLRAIADRRAAGSAVAAADQDVRRAEQRRDAGMASEADVLALEVHRARMRQQQIAMAADERVARARLNQAMGVPIERDYEVQAVAPGPVPDLPSLDEMERQALEARPEMHRAALQEQMAAAAGQAARSAFLPQVSVQGVFEWNGSRFGTRASAWTVGAQARWNVFSGFGDVARLREAGQAAAGAAAERDRTESAIRVDVRAAAAALDSARARLDVGQAAVAQARETQRIIRGRYEAGLAAVNDVLAAATALVDAESLQTAALVDLFTSRAALDRALGTAR